MAGPTFQQCSVKYFPGDLAFFQCCFIRLPVLPSQVVNIARSLPVIEAVAGRCRRQGKLSQCGVDVGIEPAEFAGAFIQVVLLDQRMKLWPITLQKCMQELEAIRCPSDAMAIDPGLGKKGCDLQILGACLQEGFA